MKKAALSKKPLVSIQGFMPPLSLWDQMLLQSANDNSMPWAKRLTLIAFWSTFVVGIALASYFIQD